MDTSEIRKKYFTFFEKKGHTVIPSASLRPENDPTTLFVGSGMQPLLPYLLGEKHPRGVRLVNSQKSFRAEDIEEVGDNRHTTFFEMLGNWSLGDYFKKEQLPWAFEFLTEEIGLNPEKLYVTVFIGDETLGIPKDTESVQIWKGLFKEKGIEAIDIEIGSEEDGYAKGMQQGDKEGRIFYYDAKKNWWSRSGTPDKMPVGEPGGPDSEMFYDFGTEHNTSFGEHCHPNCDCGRFMEIGNSVFMEYIKKEDGSFVQLPQKNVDFGGGLERIAAATNGNSDIFLIDTLQVIIEYIEKTSGKKYDDTRYTHAFRVIADHIRAAIFIIADGVVPSNSEQGYFVRRLIRRAVRYADLLGVPDGVLAASVTAVSGTYKDQYEILLEKGGEIAGIIAAEEEKFRKTLTRGLKEFEKLSNNNISGNDAFILFTTYGFPYELTEELAEEKGISVDRKGFDVEMKKHQELSRSGSEQKFKGGLVDHGEMSIKYHTATHLLNQALRNVLGNSVQQKGSNITPERMRFDFSFDRKMTDEEKKKVEDIVNEHIKAAIVVTNQELPLEEAKKLGAIGLFEEKYGDVVKVYTIGDFSLEFCGGPHVTNTSQLGHFKIVKEESISAGVRRIRAVLE
ncbi:alanine--tRNA ligase [Candidatus Kaiserbacteria bacterium]|nr:alanine--tRNA ligase [Candidatus Kaiserbacteria bacterium]